MKKKFSWKGAGYGLIIGLFCMVLVHCVGNYVSAGKNPCISNCSKSFCACTARANSMRRTYSYQETQMVQRAHTRCAAQYTRCTNNCRGWSNKNNGGGQVYQK